MFFRKNHSDQPDQAPTTTVFGTPLPPRQPAPRLEYIGITLTELELFEGVLLHAEERTRQARPDLSHTGRITELIGRLYQSAGAASVTQPDRDLVRVPVGHSDFMHLEWAIRDITAYQGDPQTAREGRRLLNRFNALLGQARAVIHMGGTPVFDPDAPAPAPHTAPELPTYRQETQ